MFVSCDCVVQTCYVWLHSSLSLISKKMSFRHCAEAGEFRPRWSYYVEMSSPRWLKTCSRALQTPFTGKYTHAPRTFKLQSLQVSAAIGSSVELLELRKFPFHLPHQNEKSFLSQQKRKKTTPIFSGHTAPSPSLCAFRPPGGKAFNLPRPGTL